MASPSRGVLRAARLGVWLLVLLLVAATPAAAGPQAANPGLPSSQKHGKLDTRLTEQTAKPGNSDVIVEFTNDKDALKIIRKFGQPGRRLAILKSYTARIPNRLLRQLADDGSVKKVSHDRPVKTLNGRTAITSGARAVQELSGYTGAGIGVAVIDSGVTSWHADLTTQYTSTTMCEYQLAPAQTDSQLGRTATAAVMYQAPDGDQATVIYQPCTTTYYAGQRVSHFADFVNGHTTAYDDFGHGTHVAGIIAGSGAASAGARTAIAPGASIIALKALDGKGIGTISNIIAAIDYAVLVKNTYNIRVINLSLGAGVYESYDTDPLTLAAKRAVDAGIVVVAAAGNLGKATDGRPQYGAITAPANAPWVLTVGASSTEGTVDRTDDIMGAYSSRGPTMHDYAAKPDLVAPGTGTVSLSSPDSLLYLTKPQSLLPGVGHFATALSYLSLTGTSMAAPAVAGTVALMLEANPNLTPNLVKAILQFTAQVYPDYNWLTQGAGFMNTRGAVRLAEYFHQATRGLPYPDRYGWSTHVFWGNRRVTGGVITPGGTAWAADVRWGSTLTPAGQNIVWGDNCADAACDNIVWGNSLVWGPSNAWSTNDGDNIVWGNTDGDNIVWGNGTGADNIVWANGDSDNIVWGNSDGDNIVWGNDCQGADCDNIVWGNAGPDNIVWGNCEGDGCDNIVWGDSDDDNIVWGNSNDDNIVWGNSDDNIVWGDSAVGAVVFGDESAEVSAFDQSVWDDLFRASVPIIRNRTSITAVGGSF